jgi:hypothetical protein
MAHYDEMITDNEIKGYHDRMTSNVNKEWEAWVDNNERRMDVIGQNGNDGLHYEEPNETCPTHYDYVIQPWEYMESIMSEEAFQGYLEGNVIKYISRWRDKGGQQDLEKCKHYLEKLLSVL